MKHALTFCVALTLMVAVAVNVPPLPGKVQLTALVRDATRASAAEAAAGDLDNAPTALSLVIRCSIAHPVAVCSVEAVTAEPDTR